MVDLSAGRLYSDKDICKQINALEIEVDVKTQKNQLRRFRDD